MEEHALGNPRPLASVIEQCFNISTTHQSKSSIWFVLTWHIMGCQGQTGLVPQVLELEKQDRTTYIPTLHPDWNTLERGLRVWAANAALRQAQLNKSLIPLGGVEVTNSRPSTFQLTSDIFCKALLLPMNSLQALQLLNVKSLLDVTAPISLACLWPRSNLQAGPIFYLGSIPAKPCFQASWLLTASRRWNATNRHLPKLSCNVKPCAVNAVLI